MSDDLTDRLRHTGPIFARGPFRNLLDEAADRIDRDGEQIKDDFWLRQELEAEVEQLRVRLARYEGRTGHDFVKFPDQEASE